MENKMETTIVYWGCIGIIETKMETTVVHWGYFGIMEKKMETTIVHWGRNWETGKQNGNYTETTIMGLKRITQCVGKAEFFPDLTTHFQHSLWQGCSSKSRPS